MEQRAARLQDEHEYKRNGRREELWNVPERARDEYLAMEYNFSPATVLDFMLAMHPEPDEQSC